MPHHNIIAGASEAIQNVFRGGSLASLRSQ